MSAPARVDFYVHATQSVDALVGTACRIADKAWQQRAGRRVVIRVADENTAGALDNQLWSFRDRAFIPHAVATADILPEDYPVLICLVDRPAPSSHRDLLINMAPTMPDIDEAYERVAELVDAEPARRQAGRERFRQWRERGVSPQTHQLDCAP
jgi:DNA polymerase-3 subunit chi